jgi:hypothetical protein
MDEPVDAAGAALVEPARSAEALAHDALAVRRDAHAVHGCGEHCHDHVLLELSIVEKHIVIGLCVLRLLRGGKGVEPCRTGRPRRRRSRLQPFAVLCFSSILNSSNT